MTKSANAPTVIRVFKDDPAWDLHSKWWMLPMHRIQELYVATYECDHDELPSPGELAHIRRLHPDCVLVHC